MAKDIALTSLRKRMQKPKIRKKKIKVLVFILQV